MRRVSPHRYALFVLIAGAGLGWDLYSKHVVFADLGYPYSHISPPTVPGRHALFAHPPRTDGISNLYLDSWLRFRLLTSFNEGALWGIGQGQTWLFALLSVAAASGIVCWLFIWRGARSLWLTVALGLVMAGTLGNLWDRLGLHGCLDAPGGSTKYAVRDFLLFQFGSFDWPVFNFADSFLVTGAIMLVLQSLHAETGKADNDNRTETASTTTGDLDR